jgi:CIC family chloride channel protein
MLGCALSGIETAFTAHATASASAYALVGMGVLVAGVLRAPLTAVLVVVEVGGSYWMILPAILAISIAYFLARTLQSRSLLELLGSQDGMRLPTIEEQKPQSALKVQDAMQAPDFPVVDSSLTLRQAWRQVADWPGDVIFVRHTGEDWTVIDRAALDQLEAISDPQQRLEDTMDASPMPQLYPDLPLDTTLRYLHRWPILPVVSRANIKTLEGVVTMNAVMARYQALEPLDCPSESLPSR